MAKFLSALETGGGCRSGSSRSAGIEPMVSVIKARSRANPSVEPSLGWTYLSREALARAKAQMDEESTGVRDEIGFLTIPERKRVVEGKSVSDSVDLGGRRILKKKNNKHQQSK